MATRRIGIDWEHRKAYKKAWYQAKKASGIKRQPLSEQQRQERKQYMFAYYSANREKYRYDKQRASKRRAKIARDPVAAIERRIRTSVCHALRAQLNGAARKSIGAVALVGCTMSELAAHLEAQFLPGMTWQNRQQWHIDHKRPCASFDLSDPAQQRECFHFSNLQPLWATDNHRKSSQWEGKHHRHRAMPSPDPPPTVKPKP